MFIVYVGLVFCSKYVQFPVICSLQYSININTVEVDPHSDLLHICIVKPKNSGVKIWNELSVEVKSNCLSLNAFKTLLRDRPQHNT